ncbi:MAG: hypothetical protein J6I80_01825 [Clostridia bacterium]|nr:hypothetical protein [Clostridia bacterium]
MGFKANLNFKFYFVTVLLLGIVALGWYGVYSIATNPLFMEDNMPMPYEEKLLLTILIGVVVTSWTVSFFVLLRQIVLGYAFVMDHNGIHGTVTAVNVLAFIFIVPIRTIPYAAIAEVSNNEGILTLHINKAELDINPMFKLFARKRYHLFAGFTVEKQEQIKEELSKYIKI